MDLGSGSGVAGMAIAARALVATVTLVERDEAALDAARRSLALPDNAAFAGRVSIIAADITAPEATRIAAGLARATADAVVTNPPFRDPHGGTASPTDARRDAHVAASGVDPWIRAATSVLKPGGRLIVVYRADGLSELLPALGGRFGGITILPIHPRADQPALRIIVSAEKGSRAPERIIPGLVLHPETGNGYLPPVEKILRDGAGLGEVHPGWFTAFP
jgi:tRNA1(Val) A37 N6-methylase TrmN6